MSERRVTVVNDKGLHARCVTKIGSVARNYSSVITIHKGADSANAKSPVGVMCLVATKGTELTIRAEGPDGEAAAAAVAELIASGFGELDD